MHKFLHKKITSITSHYENMKSQKSRYHANKKRNKVKLSRMDRDDDER